MLNFIRSYSTRTSKSSTDLPIMEKDDEDKDTDVEVDVQTCVLCGDNLIVSNSSPLKSKIKFGIGSFSFQYADSCIIIRLNRVFLWNLVKQMKTISSLDYEVDYIRIRSFVSYYMNGMNPDMCICVYEDRVNFKRNGANVNIKTDKYFPTLLLAYNCLYNDIRRLYNTPERTTEIINECSDIVQLIGNPSFDKREHKIGSKPT
jgi:hypothetical protein